MTDPAPPVPTMTVLLANRQEGKTTQALAWLTHGHPIDAPPGWSRVLVVPNTAAARYIDLTARASGIAVPDLHRRVFGILEWTHKRGIGRDVEVCLDDLDQMWTFGITTHALPGRITAATMTARPWVHLAALDNPRTM